MPTTLRGIARVDRRTKNLVRRLRRGEIAVIGHRDLDSVSAEALVGCGVRAIVNAETSISGRYPNEGPSILLEHGIPILDAVGPDVMERVRDGMEVEIDLHTGVIHKGDVVCGRGVVLTRDAIDRATTACKSNLSRELRAFVENTLHYVAREEHILFEAIKAPELKTSLWGRHALVAVRGENYRNDLWAIRSYIRDMRPVLIGVDGGADALMELGFRPHIIIGDMDSVSDEALRCGAELVVHASPQRGAPGLVRIQDGGWSAVVVEATGTSEDAALLLAYEKGADLIVAVGTHTTLFDFLDKGRGGMASTFLTRLRVGHRLVDARGVSRLYSRRLRLREVLLLFIAGILAASVVIASSPPVRDYLALAWRLLRLRLSGA